jgi:hypothetical protein
MTKKSKPTILLFGPTNVDIKEEEEYRTARARDERARAGKKLPMDQINPSDSGHRLFMKLLRKRMAMSKQHGCE